MKKLSIDLKNCYGINSLEYEFELNEKDKKNFIIYAQNGIFKTSFTKTLKNKIGGKENEIRDEIYEDKIPKHNIKLDDKDILGCKDEFEILVFNSFEEEYSSEGYVTTMLASKELQKEHKKLENEQNNTEKFKDNIIEDIESNYGIWSENILLQQNNTQSKELHKHLLNFCYKDFFSKENELFLSSDFTQSIINLYKFAKNNSNELLDTNEYKTIEKLEEIFNKIDKIITKIKNNLITNNNYNVRRIINATQLSKISNNINILKIQIQELQAIDELKILEKIGSSETEPILPEEQLKILSKQLEILEEPIKKFIEEHGINEFSILNIYNVSNIMEGMKFERLLRNIYRILLKIIEKLEIYKKLKPYIEKIKNLINKISNLKEEKEKYILIYDYEKLICDYIEENIGQDFKKHHKLIENLDNLEILENNYLEVIAENEKDKLNRLKQFKQRDEDNDKEINEKIKKQENIWLKIIKIFNDRFFFMPFHVKIGNSRDVILLKSNTAEFKFFYKDKFADKNDKKEKEIEKKNLNKILSNGEKRALYIMQILFEIESRKEKNGNKKFLLVFDDICDSFDYQNKYAIVEYLLDISEEKNFYMICLTHNFDFYRILNSRLEKKKSIMVVKNKNGIFFKDGKDISFFIDDTDIVKETKQKLDETKEAKKYKKKIENEKNFLSFIAFARNIIEYTKSQKDEDYKTLTNCLHIKEETKKITLEKISNIYKKDFNIDTNKKATPNNKKYFDFLMEVSDSILKEKEIDEICLQNKIILSIAIRLKTEEYLIKKFNLDYEDKNQTRELYNKAKDRLSEEEKNIIRRVLIITPEHIHINSFMYEPLLDTSIYILKELYDDVKKLSKNKS